MDRVGGLVQSRSLVWRPIGRRAGTALVALGDMPAVLPAHLDRMIEVFAAAHGQAIIVPVHQGQRGNPVLWPARYFPEILQLDGDLGARRLLATHAEQIREVALDAAAILLDVDTPQALAQLRERLTR